jgi:hypothetical protein
MMPPVGVLLVKLVAVLPPIFVLTSSVIVLVSPAIVAIGVPAAIDRPTVPESGAVKRAPVIVKVVVIECGSERNTEPERGEGQEEPSWIRDRSLVDELCCVSWNVKHRWIGRFDQNRRAAIGRSTRKNGLIRRAFKVSVLDRSPTEGLNTISELVRAFGKRRSESNGPVDIVGE